MRFILILILTICGIGISFYYEIGAPIMLQFFYFGGQGLWYGPAWFKPVIYVNCVAIVIILVKNGTIKIGNTGWLLILFCIVMGISSSQAIRSSKVAFDYTFEISKFIITYLIFYNIALAHGTKYAKIFLWTNIIGGAYLSKSVLFAYVIDPSKRVDSAIGQGGGANYIAMLFAMFIPYLITQAEMCNGFKRVIMFASAGIFAICIVATGSRAGLITLVLLGIYFVFQKKQNKIKIFITACLLSLCLLPFIPDYYFERMQTVTSYSEDESANNRIILWKAAYDNFLDNPLLGIGPKNFYLVSHLKTGIYSKMIFEGERVGLVSHNTYLEILSETGSCGFLLLLALIFLNIKKHSQMSSFCVDDANVRIGLEGGLIAYAVCAMFGSLLLRDVIYWYLAVYNGWADNMLDQKKEDIK